MINRPSGLLVELQYHLIDLKDRLALKQHTELLSTQKSSLLHQISVATLVLARIGGNPFNYSQIKAKAQALTPALLQLLEELLSMVSL